MILTEWYSGDQKPCREGVYERDYTPTEVPALNLYCYFDGRVFGGGSSSPELAERYFTLFGASIYQKLNWRGVAK